MITSLKVYGICNVNDLDIQIFNKLTKAGINFYKPRKTPQNAREIAEYFKTEMLDRHIDTIMQFLQFCNTSLLSIVLKKSLSKFDNQYAVLALMIVGYTEGAGIAFESLSLAFSHSQTKSKYAERIENNFSEAEYEKIKVAIPVELANFKELINACKSDLEKDRTTEKEQWNILQELFKAIKKGKDYSGDLYDITKRIDMPLIVNIYTKNVFQQIRGTVAEQLAALLIRLFLYWDVLHHAGFRNISNNYNIHHIKWQK